MSKEWTSVELWMFSIMKIVVFKLYGEDLSNFTS
jgi:hypothetical protein